MVPDILSIRVNADLSEPCRSTAYGRTSFKCCKRNSRIMVLLILSAVKSRSMFSRMGGTKRTPSNTSRTKGSRKSISSETRLTKYALAKSFSSGQDADRVVQGGNDYEIYSDPRTEGHAVKNPGDTARIIKEIFDL